MSTPYEQFALGEPKNKIVCGLCEGDLEGPADPNAQDTFRCVGCGNSDTFENVMSIASQHLEERAAEGFQGSIGKGTRRNKILTFEPGFIPKGKHRFIVKGDL